jgi:hypothetical protein
MTRKITNLKFWWRPMARMSNHWRLRLSSVIGEPVVRIWDEKNGITEWDILGIETRTVMGIRGGPVAARNAAQRYLEKLAADIERESVKR